MKKTSMQLTALGLSVVLALGGAGGVAYAGGSEAVKAPAMTTKLSAVSAAAGTAAYRDETVYVFAGADGGVEKVVVSDWLKNPEGLAQLKDTAALTGVENVKGYALSTPSGTGRIWDAQGGDVYCQGTAGSQDLPVDVSVSYTLDGRSIAPDQLAGKSGRVTIRFDYTNRQSETVTIDGKTGQVFVPFAMVTALLLDGDRFTNVDVTNARITSDGDQMAIVGLAFPGLQESLGLEEEDIEIPSYVEIAADVTDFELETTFTVAVSSPFAKLDTDKLDGTGGINDSLDELADAMEQLMDGSDQLYDGLGELLEKSGALSSGVDQLAGGSAALQSGADDLKAGAAQLQTGASQLSGGAAALQDGLEQLSGSSATINGGAEKVFNNLLASATQQLTAAGAKVPELTAENYGTVLDGVITLLGDSPAAQQVAAVKASLDNYNAFYQGLQQYTAGVDQAAGGVKSLTAGASQLSDGAAALHQGASALSDGAAQLNGGLKSLQQNVPALVDGVTKLHDGAGGLSDGLDEFNEKGVQKIVDALDGDLDQLVQRLRAVAGAAKDYRTFSGGDEADGQVKFIYRTAAVKAE